MPVDTNTKEEISEYITETRGTRLKYNPKKSDSTDVSVRVMVISPYQQLNAYCESEIPKQFPKTSVDVICHSDFDNPPYINVNLNEENKKIPNWIIDFQRIISRVPSLHYVQKIISQEISTLPPSSFHELLKVYTPERWSTQIEEILDKQRDYLNNRILHALNETTDENKITGIVEFKEYNTWRSDKNIIYISPTEQFVKSLDELHVYDEKGNFCSDQVPIKPFQPQLLNNLEQIIDQRKVRTKLLFEWK